MSDTEALYGSASSLKYGLNYTARHRFEGSEVMFFSELLDIPQVPRPASVKLATVVAAA